MFGTTLGEGVYGGALPPWRKIVEADAVAMASAGSDPAGESTALTLTEIASTVAGQYGTSPLAAFSAQPMMGVAMSSPSVEVAPSGATMAAAAMTTSSTAEVVEASGEFSAAAAVSVTSGVLHVGSAPMRAEPSADGRGSGIALTRPQVAAQTLIEGRAEFRDSPPTVEVQEPMLQPIAVSHEATVLESELKELFMGLFEDMLRPDERFMNAMGMPQLGSRELVDQALTSDALAINRGANSASGSGSYLLRAWRSHNPKRGLHLLKTYLQLLWPNVWEMHQMWQDNELPYPEGLTETDEGNHFLTSRVHVSLPGRATTGGDVYSIRAGLFAALPARMVLNLSITEETATDAGIAIAYYGGTVAQSFEGTFA